MMRLFLAALLTAMCCLAGAGCHVHSAPVVVEDRPTVYVRPYYRYGYYHDGYYYRHYPRYHHRRTYVRPYRTIVRRTVVHPRSRPVAVVHRQRVIHRPKVVVKKNRPRPKYHKPRPRSGKPRGVTYRGKGRRTRR